MNKKENEASILEEEETHYCLKYLGRQLPGTKGWKLVPGGNSTLNIQENFLTEIFKHEGIELFPSKGTELEIEKKNRQSALELRGASLSVQKLHPIPRLLSSLKSSPGVRIVIFC